MCVGDWRLGRLITTRETQWDTTGSPTNIIFSPNRQRVGIDFVMAGLPATASQYVQIEHDGKNFVTLNQQIQYYHFTLLTHGVFVQHKFRVLAGLGNFTGFTIEYIMPEDYLAAGLREFESKYMNR